MPFIWRILSPNYVSPSELIYDDEKPISEKVYFNLDEQPSFGVDQPQGILEPKEEKKFGIFFNPKTVSKII